MCDYVTWTFVCNRRITLIRGVLTTLFLTFGRLSFEWLSLFGTPSYSVTLLHKYYGHWILSKMHLSPLLSDSTRVRCDVFIHIIYFGLTNPPSIQNTTSSNISVTDWSQTYSSCRTCPIPLDIRSSFCLLSDCVDVWQISLIPQLVHKPLLQLSFVRTLLVMTLLTCSGLIWTWLLFC